MSQPDPRRHVSPRTPASPPARDNPAGFQSPKFRGFVGPDPVDLEGRYRTFSFWLTLLLFGFFVVGVVGLHFLGVALHEALAARHGPATFHLGPPVFVYGFFGFFVVLA